MIEERAVSLETLRSVRRIEFAALRFANHLHAGDYSSVFKGQGIEFADVRRYEPGDDARAIDWNVTARLGQPYIKRYVEEREAVVMLLADASGSTRVGSRELKSRLCAEVCAALALAAVKNNDKTGLILFTDRVEKHIPPRKGRRHALRIAREALTCRPTGNGTDLRPPLELFARICRRRSAAFLLSDFYADGYEAALKAAASRHRILAVEIRDPLERAIPKVGWVRWKDAESGAVKTSAQTRLTARQDRERNALFKRLRIDCARLETGRSFVEPLLSLFRRGERRRT